MSHCAVITYQTSAGACIDLTPPQIRILERAGRWPKDARGEEYCSVSHGQHFGTPTFRDAQIAAFASGTEVTNDDGDITI